MINFYEIFNDISIVKVEKTNKNILIYEVILLLVSESTYANKVIFCGDPGNCIYDKYPAQLNELRLKFMNFTYNLENIKIFVKEASNNKYGVKLRISDIRQIDDNKTRINLSVIDSNNVILTAVCVFFEKYSGLSQYILMKKMHLKYLNKSVHGLIEQKDMFVAEMIETILLKNTFSPSYYEIIRLAYYCAKKEINKNEVKKHLQELVKKHHELENVEQIISLLIRFLNSPNLFNKLKKYISIDDFCKRKDTIISKLTGKF